MTAAAARVFPNWVLLEPYVFRRDDDESFPDDTVAPIRASGTTSWGADFRIAFSVADPPSISRLYAQLPGFPGPLEMDPLQVVATHRHLALLAVMSSSVQNFFIFKADQNKPSSSSLRALPQCTEPRYVRTLRDNRRRCSSSNATPRLLHEMSSGLWCGDKGEEFVVAELTLFIPTRGRTPTNAFADMCFLRSSFTDDQLGKWEKVRVPIQSTTEDDLWKLAHWITHASISFQGWLCWIDYRQGILFWDVSQELPAATASFLWFPENICSLSGEPPCTGSGRVSVVDHGRLLKFVYVARRDGGSFYGPLKPGVGFIITCYTLVLGRSMEWNKDCTVTSDDLTPEGLPDGLQRGLPMFPQVDIDRPEVVHFLFNIESGKPYRKMSVLSIDMIKKTVVSFYLYMDGDKPLETEDTHFIMAQRFSPTPSSFLTCEFPRFCNLSRERKGME